MNKDSKENNRKCQGQSHFSWPCIVAEEQTPPYHLNTGRPSGKSDTYPEKVIFILKLVPFLNTASLLYTLIKWGLEPNRSRGEYEQSVPGDTEATFEWNTRKRKPPNSFPWRLVGGGGSEYRRVPFQHAYNHSQIGFTEVTRNEIFVSRRN